MGRPPFRPLEALLKLLDLVPPLLHPVPPGSREDERAFDAFAAGIIRQLGMLAAVMMLVATLAWWPLDASLLSSPAELEAFDRLRSRGVVVEVTSLLAMLVMPNRTPWLEVVSVSLYALLLYVFGEALGSMGADSAPTSPLLWLADAWIGIVPIAVLPLPFALRALGVSLVGGALAAGFFVAHPDNLTLSGAWAQLSFAVFAGAFTMAAGEGTFQVTRRAFFERQALDHAREALENLTASLSDQVAERTDALHQLTQHLDTAQEAERRRLAHDLHDDLGQQLTAMRYTVARLAGRLGRDKAGAELVQDLEALLDGTLKATRGVVTRLRPRILDDLGLVPAVEWLCEDAAERSGVPCVVVIDDSPMLDGLDAARQLALFRVAQEATTNALRHGAPSTMSVHLRAESGGVLLEVHDDGAGFDPEAAEGGFGLLGLRERLRALGGELTLRSQVGKGTTLTAALPTKERSP